MRDGTLALLRFVFRPLGYLAFVVALGALSLAAKMLGDDHELGFFSGRVAQTIWRYPEVTRRGVQVAWLVWLVLFVLAVSPLSATHWDEVVLAAVALAVLWRRLVGGNRVAR
ncbi:MAG: hypothetical protein E6G05_15450 [Actinobacteria bacterium]|nr:MAG: hypothetical protein E6G05_15450 [Actinomycetota bacterium]